MGPAKNDSLWGIYQNPKSVSIDAFWMDQTEITNAQYRQFVYWVRDSIIRERLFDPAYGGNDLFKITEDFYIRPLWLGSRVGQPLVDFGIVPGEEGNLIRTIEREQSGKYLLAEYRWRGFGLEFIRYIEREISLKSAQNNFKSNS